MDVRPMMEVVKGTAFDILQAAGGCPTSLRPGRWLDLYSSTGSVGIEALSWGCSEVHFVKMDPWVVSDVLRPNLEWTSFLDVSVIHTARVERFLEQAERFVDGPFDYISVTPPYTAVDYGVLMDQVSKSSVVGEDTFIVVEYPLRTDMLDSCGCLIKISDRRFGRTHLAIYGPKWAQKKRKLEKFVWALARKVRKSKGLQWMYMPAFIEKILNQLMKDDGEVDVSVDAGEAFWVKELGICVLM
ncbi:putative rRNA methyltransferase YlbH [Camellia lanceoleosa]|uniref:rRNA methyltransferase YlbH n=1 Tax=Camellia lanceoleosa TaxID=1840588 RepID=A0ACC0G675_9ERIC|nr:putative rRNA methyltransferase YlbH [Camellia lanceoleosa]